MGPRVPRGLKGRFPLQSWPRTHTLILGHLTPGHDAVPCHSVLKATFICKIKLPILGLKQVVAVFPSFLLRLVSRP